MSAKDFLVEIHTEELPPKALYNLSLAFADHLQQSLEKSELKHNGLKSFATPRRLAVIVKDLDTQQEDKSVQRRGPAVQAAFNENGEPTPAALGFAKSCGVNVDELEKLETDKGAWLVFDIKQEGQQTRDLIPAMVEEALHKLPIPKRMRWGNRTAQFVRPVHSVIMLLGNDIVDCNILDIPAGRHTQGHRFHCTSTIEIPNPADYETLLETEGKVIADFNRRRDAIKAQIEEAALSINGSAVIDPALLIEVTGLVEWPVAVLGSFDEKFLEIPAEALISAMKGHQKYFHLFKDEKLMPNFITISNIDSKNLETVRKGNERVIRPRLSDADFFWNTDLKTPLISELEKLKTVVFQNKLGTVYEKVSRVGELSMHIAQQIDADAEKAKRAATLAKCDLMTEMVGEFPELQGIMGRYYAIHDHESTDVAEAILEHYMPRFASDDTPPSVLGQIVSIADKLDTLVGIFSIGLIPTGDKDPFALRRASLGILRTIIENKLDLDLKELLGFSRRQYNTANRETVEAVFYFMMDRLKGHYLEAGFRPQVFEAVQTVSPSKPMDFDSRIKSIATFEKTDAAESLAAANKRIANILKKNEEVLPTSVDEALFDSNYEKGLYSTLNALENDVHQAVEANNYDVALSELAKLKEPVDAFFDNVMVMVDAKPVRLNRLCLLNGLYSQFKRIADISCL